MAGPRPIASVAGIGQRRQVLGQFEIKDVDEKRDRGIVVTDDQCDELEMRHGCARMSWTGRAGCRVEATVARAGRACALGWRGRRNGHNLSPAGHAWPDMNRRTNAWLPGSNGRRELPRRHDAARCPQVSVDPLPVRKAAAAVALLFATAASAASAMAQQGVLTGSVRDDRGTPLAGVQIQLRGNTMRTTTNELGQFRFTGVPVGITYVSARGPGVLPAVELLRVTPEDTLEFVLDRVHENEDSTVAISAEKAFESDVKRYAAATAAARTAVAFTKRDIAGIAPAVTTDLFRGPVGFRVIGQGSTAVVITSNRNCQPNIFIDGQEQLPRFNINEIRPRAIKLLLAYNSYAILPPELRSVRVDQLCGAISILTR